MARRRFPKRRFRKRRFRFRKRRFTLKRRRINRSPKIHIKRTRRLTFSVANVVNSLSNFQDLNFQLDELPDYTEFTQLFKYVRFNKIVVTLIPNRVVNQTWTDTGTGNVYDYTQPYCLTTIDPFWVTPSGATGEDVEKLMMQNNNCRRHQGFGKISRKFTPCLLHNIVTDPEDTAVQYPAAPEYKKWYSTYYANLDLLGMQIFFNFPRDVTSGSLNYPNIDYSMFITYYMSFKGIQ